MNGAESGIPRTGRPGIASLAQGKGRYVLALLVIAPLLVLVFWECGHRIRFGDFFTYGYHSDLIEDHSDLGVPRRHAAYCLRVTNYSFSVLKFEAIQTPEWGIWDGQVVFHDRIEKWDGQGHSWLTVGDSVTAAEPSFSRPNTTKNVWPGRSIYPTGCYELAALEGIHKGDVVRLVAFTSYSKTPPTAGHFAFHSSAFTVNEEPPRGNHP